MFYMHGSIILWTFFFILIHSFRSANLLFSNPIGRLLSDTPNIIEKGFFLYGVELWKYWRGWPAISLYCVRKGKVFMFPFEPIKTRLSEIIETDKVTVYSFGVRGFVAIDYGDTTNWCHNIFFIAENSNCNVWFGLLSVSENRTGVLRIDGSEPICKARSKAELMTFFCGQQIEERKWKAIEHQIGHLESDKVGNFE